MSSASISSVIKDLFNAPLQAAVKADADYLAIWAKWLKFKKHLMFDDTGAPLPGVDINEVLKTAPIVEMSGNIDLAITMRITEVEEKNGSLSCGVSVGPIYASGSFGMSRQSTQESIFQAASTFVMTNQKRDLTQFMQLHNYKIENGKQLDEVADKLNKASTSLVDKV